VPADAHARTASADAHAAQVILWDSLEEPPHDAAVLLWEAFAPAEGADRGRIVSLSERVERDAESLRPRLLGFIAAVGRHRVDGRSVDEHLELREGLSAWRMTPFHSRPYTTRGRLHHAARLMVLESLLADRRGATLEVRTASRGLARACAGIARHHGLRVVHSRPPRGLRGPGLGGTPRRRLKDALPGAVLAALAVRDHLRAARALHRRTRSGGTARSGAAGDTNRGASEVTVVDYWFRFGTQGGDAFSSQYWTRLVDALRARPARTSWLHLIVDDRSGGALRGVATRLATMRAAQPREDHAVLDGHGGWATVRGALADYLRLRRRAAPVARAAAAFAIPGTEASLWPLFAADWRHGLRGGEAMQACLRLRALEHVVGALPRQRLGIYLMENQPWEMAFVHAWRRAGHGTLVGVAHSTVRWWDLRFLADATQYAPGRLAMPRPDLVAVNGALARRALERAAYPRGELVEVEALMYLDARRTDADRDAAAARGPLRLLVATDFMPEATARQLGLLVEALPRLGAHVQVTVKPHWREHLPPLPAGVHLADGSADLATLLTEADALYVSTITSAALDAVLAGLRVVQCLDPGSFDLSPLRGDARVATVRSGGELAEALERLAADPRPVRGASDTEAAALLHLDPTIPRWRSLLDGAPA
jgi:surface carbohydrate biosynthesis protein (TIGR04326 family)